MSINKINVNGTEYDLDVLVDGSSVSTALGNTATVALSAYRGKVFAGSTSTAAGTAAKVVTVNDTLWTLNTGDLLLLTASATNTAASATFNVNGSGAKAVKYAGAAIAAPNLDKAGNKDNAQLYIYDGTNWVWLTGTTITANRLANTAKVGDTNKPVYFTANGVPAAISYTIGKSVPSNAVFTDTDTKVTSVDNHYTPTADSASELTAAISGTAGAYVVNTQYTVLTGIKAQRDAAGHITGLTYTAQNVKDTNTTYSAGTAAQLSAGTDTSNRLWQAKILHDYIDTAVSNGLTGLGTPLKLAGSGTTLPTSGNAGDVYLKTDTGKEYVYNGTDWVEFGDEGSYALKTVTVTGTGVLSGGGDLTQNRTISHNTSGITAGSYGPTADVTGSNNTTIKVPQITVDTYGHVTGVTERTYTSVNNTYTIYDKALKVASNSGTATNAITMNSSADRTLTVKGDGTYITGAVSGSANAAVVTLSHADAGSGSALTTSTGTAGSYALNTEYTVVTGVTISADAKGHITGVSTTTQKIKDTNTTYSAATQSANGLMSSTDK